VLVAIGYASKVSPTLFDAPIITLSLALVFDPGLLRSEDIT
jgi:hypothetical protein